MLFKNKWNVIGVYRNRERAVNATELIVDKSTKKEAINKMYDHLCWDKDGLRVGFRDVEIVKARKL